MSTMEEANEYFENEQAKANMRADYREAVPRCTTLGCPRIEFREGLCQEHWQEEEYYRRHQRDYYSRSE
jgi:hypothetical protein